MCLLPKSITTLQKVNLIEGPPHAWVGLSEKITGPTNNRTRSMRGRRPASSVVCGRLDDVAFNLSFQPLWRRVWSPCDNTEISYEAGNTQRRSFGYLHLRFACVVLSRILHGFHPEGRPPSPTCVSPRA